MKYTKFLLSVLASPESYSMEPKKTATATATSDQIDDRLGKELCTFEVSANNEDTVISACFSKIKDLKKITPIHCCNLTSVVQQTKQIYVVVFDHENPNRYLVCKFSRSINMGGWSRSLEDIKVSIFESFNISDVFPDEIKNEINNYLSNVPSIDDFLSKKYFPGYKRSVQFISDTEGDSITAIISMSGDDSEIKFSETGISVRDAFVLAYIQGKRILLQKPV